MNGESGLSISYRCIKVTRENASRVASLIPNFTNQSLNRRIEELKHSSNLEGFGGERYPVIAIITNPSSQNAKDVCITGNVDIKSNSTHEIIQFEVNVQEIEVGQKHEVILFDASGIKSSVVNIESVIYQLGNELPANQHKVSGPYLVDMDAYRNPFGGFRDGAELKSYYLLNIYTKEGYHIRGWMLRKLYELLAQVNIGKYKVGDKEFVIPASDVAKVRSIIQIEIVSKIMMYIEDLVILLLSNRELSRNYYDYLDMKDPKTGDIGDMIGRFLKNLDMMPHEELREMLCYIDPKSISLKDKDKAILSKLIEENIKEVKSLLKWVEIFRNTHAQIFRRYKHAGIPIRPGVEINLAGSDNPYANGAFDSFAMVLTGENPLKDSRLLPYSDKVMIANQILILSIEFFISEFLTNKIACINRGIERLVPLEMYGNPGNFTIQEIQAIKRITDQYYNKRPIRAQNHFLELNTRETKANAKWYIELDSFIAEAQSKKTLQDRYGLSL